jgi:metallo-beta-lactamase family protein
MELKFCGAAQFVTGSSHLITTDEGKRILLDCGLFQGKGKYIWEWNNEWLFDPKTIDYVILSHAHIDHSGRLPKLVRDGFRGKIVSTHATRSLCTIMLMDSAKIQERDVEWHNKKLLKKRRPDKRKIRKPLYQMEDVTTTMSLFTACAYDQWVYVSDSLQVEFRDAGHILGSASVNLKVKENNEWKSIGFTGDIGRPDRPILRDPQIMGNVDYLICESTYGGKLHEAKPEQSAAFLDLIKEACCEKKGKLIIPAFSVGRTQEIVYMLDQMETAGVLPHIPVYVDSPLAVNATQVFGSHPECYDENLHEYLLLDDNPFGWNNLHYVKDVATSKWLNEFDKPCIIISSSGMMNAGRVKHHLFNNIENENSTFLIVGYCSPDTPGGMLRDGIESIKLFGEIKNVRATVKIMDSFSAHADQQEMYDFIENQKPHMKQLFLVHGEPKTQEIFKTFLNEKGFDNVTIPEKGQTITI